MKVAFLSRMRQRWLGNKAEAFATEIKPRISRSICHGNKTKNKHLPRNDTEFHGRKNKQKQKSSHGMTRNFTEKTEAETRKEEQAEALATETKHCFQSRMRQRRFE